LFTSVSNEVCRRIVCLSHTLSSRISIMPLRTCVRDHLFEDNHVLRVGVVLSKQFFSFRLGPPIIYQKNVRIHIEQCVLEGNEK
jgi:hypothetical protein